MKRIKSSTSIQSAFEVFRKKKKPLTGETKVDLTPKSYKIESPVKSSNEGQDSLRKKSKFLKKKLSKKHKLTNGHNSQILQVEGKQKLSNGHNSQIQQVEEDRLQVGPMTKSKRTADVPCGNSESDKCLTWLIYPVQRDVFFSKTWEKKPLHIKDRGMNYYAGIFSCSEFDKILRQNHLKYQININVVSYFNGKKEVIDADGRAYAAVIWDHYQNGHSIQFLNPQTYSKPMWKLCSLLQEFFGSFTGANMYLTPPGSQGFAPHYDDIEAFVLQLEGYKQWKVYAPRSENERLPRLPSRDFQADEIGEPILEVELEPGDLLYFPRGFIHQAQTREDSHSLHLTVSTNQKNTWGDLLQLVLPQALEAAMESCIDYRESLPKDYMNFMGVACSDDTQPDWGSERHAFVKKLNDLTKKLSNHILPDTCADLMAKDYLHGALPPCLTQDEKNGSVHGNSDLWKDGQITDVVEIEPENEIRLIRKRAVRLVGKGQDVKLYHCFENTRIFKEGEPQYVQIEGELAPAVETLFMTYPAYVTISELPLDSIDKQMDIATLLYDKGLVELKPCPVQSDESS